MGVILIAFPVVVILDVYLGTRSYIYVLPTMLVILLIGNIYEETRIIKTAH